MLPRATLHLRKAITCAFDHVVSVEMRSLPQSSTMVIDTRIQIATIEQNRKLRLICKAVVGIRGHLLPTGIDSIGRNLHKLVFRELVAARHCRLGRRVPSSSLYSLLPTSALLVISNSARRFLAVSHHLILVLQQIVT